MDSTRLREILASFADDPTSLEMEKGRLVVQIQHELISATMTTRSGDLYITEEDETLPAAKWVANRIAQLDYVADRVLDLFKPLANFVTPSGSLLDLVGETVADDPQPVTDALVASQTFLERKPGGVCSVLYLTSDAGEGKTTLIRELARRQAIAYREKRTDWLLLPFSLGGNPFLRLDNVIAAGLLNQLRIRRFYTNAFLQLVRLGFIIPALDGFEEVFVETSGEAASSLGNLIRDMRGEGSLLVAARTAYFEYKRMDRQAKLFDTIPNFEVGFGRIALARWSREEFIAYCGQSGVNNPEDLYRDLSDHLGPDHALLTRAFFVSRIAELAETAAGVEFLRQIQPHVQDSFGPFVDQILEREVTEKWLDKFSQPAGPLLTVSEHHELLRLLAEEMWTSKRGSMPTNTCEDLADIYCEEKRKSAAVTRQVRERLQNHALLIADPTGTQVGFAHDHFREFFLGEQLGEYIRTRSAADIRKILRVDSVSGWTLDSAIAHALKGGGSPAALLKIAHEMSLTEGPTSFVRENGGGICIRLAEKLLDDQQNFAIEGMTFPENALSRRLLSGVVFRRCYFRSTSLYGELKNVEFASCEFEHLETSDEFSFHAVTFSDCLFHGLTVSRGDQVVEFYDPSVIESYLSTSGASLLKQSQTLLLQEAVPEDDEQLQVVRKLIQVFSRATQVSDSVLKLRLSVHAPTFFNDMVVDLLRVGVLRSVKNRGGGVQQRFGLGQSMSVIGNAMAEARGSYPAFLDLMARNPARTLEDDDAHQ